MKTGMMAILSASVLALCQIRAPGTLGARFDTPLPARTHQAYLMMSWQYVDPLPVMRAPFPKARPL